MNTLTPTDPDSIVLVTASDLKYANLIFVEHKKLLTDNKILTTQVNTLTKINTQLERVDSLRSLQIKEYDSLTQSYNSQIQNLNKALKRKNQSLKGWQIGGVAVTIGLALFLIFK